jgi:integrase
VVPPRITPNTREEAERFANTVGAVAEVFIKDMKRRGLRNAGEFEAIIRRELLPKWRDSPISEITRKDAAKLIRDIMNRSGEIEPGRRRRMSGGPWAAHHAFAIAKTMFGWALDQDEIGLAASPFDSLKPKKLIGPKEPRQRTLDESEIRIVWKAAELFGGPYGDLLRVLVLTGQRLSQTATMQRAEPDLDKALWNSPAAKMKMKKPHVTPLAPAAADVLRERLRQPIHGNGYLFSTTHGERPISGFSKFKRRLDRLIEEIRGAEAGSTGMEPMPPWTLHDLRRTVRTKLPELGVPDVVAEAVLAHGRPGVKGVYDLYTYLPEKRDALEGIVKLSRFGRDEVQRARLHATAVALRHCAAASDRKIRRVERETRCR